MSSSETVFMKNLKSYLETALNNTCCNDFNAIHTCIRVYISPYISSYFDNCFRYSFVHNILADPRQKNIEKIIFDTIDESLLIDCINGITKQKGNIIRIVDEDEYIEECNVLLYHDQTINNTRDVKQIVQAPFSKELQQYIHNDKQNFCKQSFNRIRSKYKDEALTDDDIRTKYEEKTSMISGCSNINVTSDENEYQERSNNVSTDPFIYIPLQYTTYKTVKIPINCTVSGCSNADHAHSEQTIQIRNRYMKLKYGQIKVYIVVNRSKSEENQRRSNLITEIRNIIYYDN